jgi:nitroreductase
MDTVREPAEGTRIVDGIIGARTSTRAFSSRPLGRRAVLEILDVARRAPSNSNTQPWRVYVLSGKAKDALSSAVGDAHRHKASQYAAPFPHFPEPLPPEYQARQEAFAARLYGALQIERSDASARHQQTGRNFMFFSAPVGMLFTIDERLERHSWLDYGMFIQNVMIAAKARGIDTCPQVSFAKYHAVIRECVEIPARETVVCGMSMGFAAPDAKVNDMRMEREPVSGFARFLGFDED